MKHDYVISYLPFGNAKFDGKPDQIARFVIKNQLLRSDDWNQFIKAYLNNMDTEDEGWRGEYWGKMMRGACLTYMYTKDEELYNVLTDAVLGLLKIQDYKGRISTYHPDHEFYGWDIWSRKYVLTGMQHYYDICRDEELKKTIVKALSAHLDYMCEKLGDGEGQKRITLASNHWLGVNSCSVLEPVLRMYQMTNNEKYKEFAEYIISTGGIEHELSLIDLALEDKVMPYDYPENKAYETMSFFEGVLMYYELFGKEEYLTAVTNFVERVAETDITIIGCSGCTHELFDNSAIVQTEPKNNVMQETCVTVTWMRLLARLHRLTGKAIYAERIEKSALNSMYGSVNTHMLPQYCQWKVGGKKVGPFVFDSYASLCNGRRGVGVGGSRFYPDGFVYGCCACIGSAGTAVYPLTAVMQSENGFVINSLWAGKIKAETPNGTSMQLEITEGFPVGGEIKVKLTLEQNEKFEIKIRVPENNKKFEVVFGGKKYSARNGYITINEEFKNGDVINVTLENTLSEVKLNGKTAFTYGVLTLARDSAKESEAAIDLDEKLVLARKCKKAIFELCEPEGEEMIRIKVALKDGTSMLLTDFASCGKKWDNEDNCNYAVWLNIE